MAEALPLPAEDDGALPPPVERRSRRRAKMLMRGELTYGERNCACHVFDLSWGGAKLRLSSPPSQQTGIRLKLGTVLELEGHVAWGSGDAVGISFQPRSEKEAFALADLLPLSCY